MAAISFVSLSGERGHAVWCGTAWRHHSDMAGNRPCQPM